MIPPQNKLSGERCDGQPFSFLTAQAQPHGYTPHVRLRLKIWDGNRAEPLTAQPSPHPLDRCLAAYGASDFEAGSRAICFCNQAPVLIVLIFCAVMRAAPPP